MPRIVRTTATEAIRIADRAPADLLADIVAAIAVSALDDSESGADTAAVVYEQLARLGIIVP
jgi:hypothetical protein